MDNKLFQVSVKALYFKEDKLLMIQENNGIWELPGGRLEKGEELHDCLEREVKEETGLSCQILEKQPSIVYSTIGEDGMGRLMVFYKVHFDNLDFKPSDECMAMQFYTKDEIKQLNAIKQLQKLTEYL